MCHRYARLRCIDGRARRIVRPVHVTGRGTHHCLHRARSDHPQVSPAGRFAPQSQPTLDTITSKSRRASLPSHSRYHKHGCIDPIAVPHNRVLICICSHISRAWRVNALCRSLVALPPPAVHRDFVNPANTPSQPTLARLTMRLLLLPSSQEPRFLHTPSRASVNAARHVRRGRSSRQRRRGGDQ